MEPCPGCGGRLWHHDRFPRKINDRQSATTRTIFLYRGECPNPECPVVTVTHYPSFAVPYRSVPAAVQEEILRQRAAGETWKALGAAFAYAPSTIRRWFGAVAARAGEIGLGLLALRLRVFPVAPLEILRLPAEHPVSQLMRIAAEVAKEFSAIGLWKLEAPVLSLARWPMVIPSPLPVFT